FTETHAFPDPDWASGLIEAHARERCAAIGPVVVNANPRPLSWANLFTDYGPLLAGGHAEAHEVADVAGHNSSYRRDLLLGYGGELAGMLALETFLHDDVRQGGHGSEFARALPFMVAGLVVQSVAEGYGYWRGPGSMTQLFDEEMRRFDYLAADDAARRHRHPLGADAETAAGTEAGA